MQQNNKFNKTILSRIKKEKSDKCLICLEDIYKKMDITYLFSNLNKICIDCFNKLEFVNKLVDFYGYKMWILYLYNDFLKSLIYQYKGCYDISLAEFFLHPFLRKIKHKYKNYSIVYPPSSDEDDKKRGFNHVKLIAEKIKLPIIDLFYKADNYKQSDQKYIKRNLINKHIKIKENVDLKNNKILIIDDIITSGNTILTLIKQIKEKYYGIIDIKILIISQSVGKMSAFVERK